jgi:hypothetical protein
MKKVLILALFLLLPSTAHAKGEGRTKHGPLVRILIVEARGVSNIVGFPLEIIGTPYRESRNHRWVWPATMIPRLATNIAIRVGSGLYDMGFYPFYVFFTDDLTSLAEDMGLPEYPWQFTEGD